MPEQMSTQGEITSPEKSQQAASPDSAPKQTILTQASVDAVFRHIAYGDTEPNFGLTEKIEVS
jgi:hypothetical protein